MQETHCASLKRGSELLFAKWHCGQQFATCEFKERVGFMVE